MNRTILHCDMNAFFASVELLDYPELKNVPMVVCGDPKNRHGIILAKNEIAKKYGVKTAETLMQAKKKCPGLMTVPPNHEKYTKYSHLINDIYYRYTDMVEPFSIDESWLDVTGSLKLFGTGRQIADTIREHIKMELGLTLSVGVSFNKIFAKMGSEYKKPDATTEITKDNYKELLWGLPAADMFFVGRVTADKLKKTGINTIGDLANSNVKRLVKLLGKQGEMIHNYANGIDDSPVRYISDRPSMKSVGNGITFARNLVNEDDIITAVTGLSDTVASRLRRYKLKACGVKTDTKDSYFKSVSRQMQLPTSTNISKEISDAAVRLVKASFPPGTEIRLITVTAINLEAEDEAV
ncbi:MAG: DNA polymerase IV, partial [Eubacteriales bacterium]|nr:DNA polymerase IV [Eubacteriales bacterium]